MKDFRAGYVEGTPTPHESPGQARVRVEDSVAALTRLKAIEAVGALDHEDMVYIFGACASELVNRRRESEIDVMRCEKFHPDNPANLERHRVQMAAYERRLQACSSVLRLLKFYGSDSPLSEAIVSWASGLKPNALRRK